MRRFWFEYYTSCTVSKMCSLYLVFFSLQNWREKNACRTHKRGRLYVYSGYEYESHHHPCHSSTLFRVFYSLPLILMMLMMMTVNTSLLYFYSVAYVTLFDKVNMCCKFLMSFSLTIHHINLLLNNIFKQNTISTFKTS